MANELPLVPHSDAAVGDRFAQMSHADLVILARQQHGQLQECRRKLFREQRQLRRMKTKRKAARAQLEDDRDDRSRVKRGPCQRYFTTLGGLSIAVRRTASNIAAGAVSMMVQMDMSDRTVSKYELKLRAAILASTKNFHSSHQLELRTTEDNALDARSFRFELHVMRGDATNAQCWQKQKLRCMELETWYMVDPIQRSSTWESVRAKLACKRIVGDLQISTFSTGGGCLALIDKQVASVGMPLISSVLSPTLCCPWQMVWKSCP